MAFRAFQYSFFFTAFNLILQSQKTLSKQKRAWERDKGKMERMAKALMGTEQHFTSFLAHSPSPFLTTYVLSISQANYKAVLKCTRQITMSVKNSN